MPKAILAMSTDQKIRKLNATALDPANYFLFQNGLPVSTEGAAFGYNAGNTRVRIRLSDNVDLTNGFPFSVFMSYASKWGRYCWVSA